MKDIMLKIVGRQIFNGTEEEENIEFLTEGRCGRKGEAVYLVYEESELSGMAGCTTSIKIQGERVEMRRYGDAYVSGTEIAFEKGKRFKGYYDTPYGAVEMEVLTDELENGLSQNLDQGSLRIAYQFSLKGLGEGRNYLDVEIVQ